MSLSGCLSKAGKAVDAQAVRAAYQANLVAGLDEDGAAMAAVEEYVASLEAEREALVAKIEEAGGRVEEVAFSRAPRQPGQTRPGQVITPQTPQQQALNAPQVSSPPAGRRDRLVQRVERAISSPLVGMIQEAEYREKRGLTHGRIDNITSTTRKLYDLFRQADQADNAAIYDYLTTRNAPASAIGNADLRQAAVDVKSTFELIGQQLVDAGLMSQAAFDKYRGAYLPRLYLTHMVDEDAAMALGSGKTPDLSRFKHRKDIDQFTREVILGEIKDPALLIAKGYGQEMRDLAIIQWLDEIAQNQNWVLQDDLVNYRGQTMTAYALEAQAAQLEKMAEYMPPQAAAMRAEAQQMLAIATAARKAHQSTPDIQKRFRQIPDSPKYGNLRGLRVLNEIYDDLVASQEVGEGETWIEQAFGAGGQVARKTVAWWKWAKVAANVPSHVRNFVSNGVLLHLSGVPFLRVPQRMMQAIAGIAGSNKYSRYYQLAKKYGLFSSTFANQELTRIDPEFLDYVARTGGASGGGAGTKAWAAARKWWFYVVNKTGDLYQFEEAIWKTAKMIDGMERLGLTAAEAARQADRALIDYSDVTRDVRALRTSAYGIPFATFMAKSAPLMLEAALKRPWSFAPYVALFAGLAQAIMSSFDVDEDDLEKLENSMPEWVRERGHTALLPWKDEQGRWQVVDLGYFLPWAQLQGAATALGSGNIPDTLKGLGMFSTPITSAITAIYTNTDPFTGMTISNEWDTPDRKLASWVGYALNLTLPGFIGDAPLHAVLDPGMTSGQGAISKTIDAAGGRLTKDGQPGPTMTQALGRFAGVNTYPVDPVLQRAENVRRLEQEVANIKGRRTQLLKNQNLTPEMRQEIVRAHGRLLELKVKEIQDYVKSSGVHPNLR